MLNVHKWLYTLCYTALLMQQYDFCVCVNITVNVFIINFIDSVYNTQLQSLSFLVTQIFTNLTSGNFLTACILEISISIYIELCHSVILFNCCIVFLCVKRPYFLYLFPIFLLIDINIMFLSSFVILKTLQ